MKTLAVSLVLGLCISLLACFSAVAVPVAGDIDSSDSVNAVDVQIVINDALGISTGHSCDVDMGGFVDAVDVQLVINAALHIVIDHDIDGLCDAAEVNIGSDAEDPDTDDDGVGDGQEVFDGTDPLVPSGEVTVPDVLGLSQTAAEDAITNAGLSIGSMTPEHNDTVAEGNIISQSPEAGTSVVPGTSVGLVISLGPVTSPVFHVEMVSVPAGSFQMGDPWGEGWWDELPVHWVTLSAYEIGKFEVTNGEYADLLNWALGEGHLTTVSSSTASAYGQELLEFSSWRISWNGSQFVAGTRDGYSMEDHPVVDVTWYGGAVYCNWLSEANGFEPCYNTSTWTCDFSKNGYHLPTEAQWERAAAWDPNGDGPPDGPGRHYRYGNGSDSISCATVNYWSCDPCNPLGVTGPPYASPVGYYNSVTSPIGCYDMSGNVWEWCNDWLFREYAQGRWPETDPTGPSSGSYRAVRGGSWYDFASDCRTALRCDDPTADPADTNWHIGFRLAR